MALMLHLGLCVAIVPSLRTPRFDVVLVRPFVYFGGWTTLYSIVGPLLVYLDRFVIGFMASAAAVAYYATPYELATKAWIVPMALVGVLFPAFTGALIGNRGRAQMLFIKAATYLFIAIVPLIAIVTAAAPELLAVWLGWDFSSHSALVLQILIVSILVNSLGFIPQP